MSSSDDAGGLSEGLAVLISGIVGIVVALAAVWYVTGLGDASTEALYRIDPTAGGGELTGVGADWTAGNTDPLLDLLVALTHAADVLMGAFVLLMLFVHWGAFRRLASRMQEPQRSPSEDGVAADGGQRTDGPQSTPSEASGGDHE
ncbi:hypothetical protein [Halobacterium bonnevillei]|jgi:hypothetical protein|uniref:Uncharacterized protein n=1 Tax=Halobacterium bonnevillei TaxID=2692200 RepID=A0A6B0SP82_9EURY|nr:hypothetical protein [Halobacterium bonnevillei]MXR20640.1 hypothetical protein [Halobacterium bonnevillei]